MSESQQILLELLTRNDDRAYQYLYRKYYAALKSFAIHYVADEAVAMDLIQDIFIGLLGNDKHFEDLNDVKLYLYTSLKNRCISYLRQQKVRDKYVLEIRNEEEEFFWDQVLEEDVYAELMAAIQQLPPQCSKVMQLVLEGHKVAEIAGILELSAETVKDHKSNGKKKLYQLLKNSPLLVIAQFIFA